MIAADRTSRTFQAVFSGSILLLRVDTPSADRAEALFNAAGMQVTRT